MKYCKKCGCEMTDDALFCEKCGEKAGGAPAETVRPVVPVEKKPEKLSDKAYKIVVGLLIGALIGLYIFYMTYDPSNNKSKITLEEFNQIQTGMSYNEVVGIVGGKGKVVSEAGSGKYHLTMYSFEGIGSSIANATVTFENGRVTGKAQIGLK